MTVKQRNALLAEMTDAVAERVLRGSLHADAGAVAGALRRRPRCSTCTTAFMRDLEAAGRLDRAIEALPDAETDRRAAARPGSG